MSENNNSLTLNRSNIDRLLFEIAKMYEELNGVPTEIIITGDAATVLNYNFKTEVSKIEVIMPASKQLEYVVNCVMKKNDLESKWININYVTSESYSNVLEQKGDFYKFFQETLAVYTLSGKYLVATKLKENSDLIDIVGILKEHYERNEPISYETLDKVMDELYEGWDGVDDKVINSVRYIMEESDVEELYYSNS